MHGVWLNITSNLLLQKRVWRGCLLLLQKKKARGFEVQYHLGKDKTQFNLGVSAEWRLDWIELRVSINRNPLRGQGGYYQPVDTVYFSILFSFSPFCWLARIASAITLCASATLMGSDRWCLVCCHLSLPPAIRCTRLERDLGRNIASQFMNASANTESSLLLKDTACCNCGFGV